MVGEFLEVLTYVATYGGASLGAAGTAIGVGEIRYRRRKKKHEKQKQAAIEARTTDGRLDEEWYDLIKGMGKEEYERLSRGALDGLEESKVHKWDAESLMGKALFDKLMREWYPERYEKPKEIKHTSRNAIVYNQYNDTITVTQRAISSSFGTPKAVMSPTGLSIFSDDYDPVKKAKKSATLSSLEALHDLQRYLGVPADSLLGRRTLDRALSHAVSTFPVDNYGVYIIKARGYYFVIVLSLRESFNANGCRRYYAKKIQGHIYLSPEECRSIGRVAVETYKMIY